MKSRIFLISALLAFCFAEAKAQVDFVSVSNADVLLVTHTALRTPGWEPDRSEAWETKLLDQKASQNLDVALYEIGDWVSSDTIRNYIQANGANLSYVYIIGDADRPDIDPDSPVWPVSDQSSGCFVPLYGEIVPAEVLLLGDIPLENDYGYIDGLDDVVVGRLPASSITEIHNYLDKCEAYLAAESPNWAKNQLLVFDDIWRVWTGCNPGAANFWEPAFTNAVPDDWTTQVLRTSTYSDDRAQMEPAFESAVNSGCGLITTLGAAANMNALSMFYFADSPFAFTNEGMYPLLLGFNCDVGSFQRPKGDPVVGAWDSCVVEKMLLLEDAGIIGSIAPTSLTLYRPDGYCGQQSYKFLFCENIRTFGNLWRGLVDLHEVITRDFPPDWQFLNLVLLGDPTLTYPYPTSPEDVENLTVHSEAANIVLTWSVVDDATSYTIYRLSTPDAVINPSDSLTTTAGNYYTDTDVTTTHQKAFYRVIARKPCHIIGGRPWI